MSDANPANAAAVPAGEKDETAEGTPRRAASMRNRLKKAFTPRKHSASSEDLSVDSAGSEGSDKKKGGWMKKLSSKVISPRGGERKAETAPAPAVAEEAKPEKEAASEAATVAKEAVEGTKDAVTGGEPVEAAKVIAAEAGKAVEEAKEAAVQVADAAGDAAKVEVPEASVAAVASQVDDASAAASREVEAAHAAVVEPVYEAVATRDVDLPKVVFEEKKAPEAKESKAKGGRRRRGPLLSLLGGVAVGVVVLAIKLAN